ncbi:metallo-hydrolase/oxidoreductase superfamily protein [Artemisia annua]|uniref:Metallo-hydrolase/oxidoreductase superfamily protein n=1 Tax=Artemisia annua TaxID=35608 RepID=A0A2U1N282_ARTAN|nr:metallo-hydrolase/oxidoreductase superfamily protein [Artemisia annua]
MGFSPQQLDTNKETQQVRCKPSPSVSLKRHKESERNKATTYPRPIAKPNANKLHSSTIGYNPTRIELDTNHTLTVFLGCITLEREWGRCTEGEMRDKREREADVFLGCIALEREWGRCTEGEMRDKREADGDRRWGLRIVVKRSTRDPAWVVMTVAEVDLVFLLTCTSLVPYLQIRTFDAVVITMLLEPHIPIYVTDRDFEVMKKTQYYLLDTSVVTPGTTVSELHFDIIQEKQFIVHDLKECHADLSETRDAPTPTTKKDTGKKNVKQVVEPKNGHSRVRKEKQCIMVPLILTVDAARKFTDLRIFCSHVYEFCKTENLTLF